MQPNLCTKSLGLSYQLWSSLDHKHTTNVVFHKNNSWSLRRSQPLISSSKYRRDSSRLSHSSSYHILVITYLFTNLIISVCPPFRPRPDSGTYYELLLSIDFIHSAEVAHCTHTTKPMASSSHSGGPTAFRPTYCHDALPATSTQSPTGWS